MKDGLSFFNTFLLVFAGIALFVGAFIIFNTFSIIVTQRQKEMALLRAIGASRKQVMRSVMLEATIVGLRRLGRRARRRHRRRRRAEGAARRVRASTCPPAAWPSPRSTVVTSLIVGTVVTLASAWFPARKAGKVPPIAAMRAVALDRTAGSRTRMVDRSVVITPRCRSRCSPDCPARRCRWSASAPSSRSSASPCSRRCSPVRRHGCSAGRCAGPPG